MRFEDGFSVPVPLPEAWDTLTDLERVYPCLPGAQLTGVEDNEFHGLVSLKLGPISASYKGTARFESLDRDNAQIVIHAQGRDRHGQGTAVARVTAVLVPEGQNQTRVEMVNDIEITGKAAQFGRGVLTDVSKEMMAEFAANLRDVVTTSPTESDEAAGGAFGSASGQAPVPAPIDTASLARRVMRKRFSNAPLKTALALAVPAALLLVWRRAAKRRGEAPQRNLVRRSISG